jgi:hypothetical protein
VAATKQQKLDSLATKQTSGEFHIEPFPKLAEMAMGYGFKRGNEMFDEAMERWRVNLEKSINKALREQDVSPGDPG